MFGYARYGPPRYWTRNDAEGTWDIQENWPPPAAAKLSPQASAQALHATGAAVESDSSSCNAEPDDGGSEVCAAGQTFAQKSPACISVSNMMSSGIFDTAAQDPS